MMAFTLLDVARKEEDLLAERYASWRGHRIPCESGACAYHLKPQLAEVCCRGVRAQMLRMLSEHALFARVFIDE
jgi:hypothetical protein